MSVRRYSRAYAEAEAVRIATEFIAQPGLRLLGTSPDSRFPAALAGKVSIRWVVLFEHRGMDGPLGVGVNIANGEAMFLE
jgi:hypothetical protein